MASSADDASAASKKRSRRRRGRSKSSDKSMAEAAAPAAAPPQQTYEERDAESDEITRVIDVDKDDAPFILGRGGATKRKVARVSCTEIELDEHTLTITIVGKRDDCDRAQDYLGFVKQQRLGARRRPQPQVRFRRGGPIEGGLPRRRRSGLHRL